MKNENYSNSLLSLPNIGKVSAKKLMQIGILNREEFLARNPYQIFDELLEKVDPTLCKCALASIVGAAYGIPWYKIRKIAIAEFKRYNPEHVFENKC